MKQTRNHYDSACYYGGRLVGRCTVSDSESYEYLMELCGGDAARVLREYRYFSPELKEILEKVAKEQQRPETAANVFSMPRQSPWGEVQGCTTLYPGVFLVTAPGHGGVMVAAGVAEILTPEARKCGFREDGYLNFEEDSQEAVVFRELLDKGLWEIPDKAGNKAGFEEGINKSLRDFNPSYWQSRQERLEKAAGQADIPKRCQER